MTNYIGAATLLILVALVVIRVHVMKRKGIEAMNFGKLDRKDFLIPPFALFYFYTIFAAAFHLPSVSRGPFYRSDIMAWIGVGFCLGGLLLFVWSLVSFGRSFRVGIDADHPDQLITSGAFGLSRNPIYVAFGSVLLGQFLIFPNWILLIYLIAAAWLIHRQVLREEDFLRVHYGQEYEEYCQRVRRYI